MKKKPLIAILAALIFVVITASCASSKCECESNKYKKAKYSMVDTKDY